MNVYTYEIIVVKMFFFPVVYMYVCTYIIQYVFALSDIKQIYCGHSVFMYTYGMGNMRSYMLTTGFTRLQLHL